MRTYAVRHCPAGWTARDDGRATFRGYRATQPGPRSVIRCYPQLRMTLAQLYLLLDRGRDFPLGCWGISLVAPLEPTNPPAGPPGRIKTTKTTRGSTSDPAPTSSFIATWSSSPRQLGGTRRTPRVHAGVCHTTHPPSLFPILSPWHPVPAPVLPVLFPFCIIAFWHGVSGIQRLGFKVHRGGRLKFYRSLPRGREK